MSKAIVYVMRYNDKTCCGFILGKGKTHDINRSALLNNKNCKIPMDIVQKFIPRWIQESIMK